MLKRQIAVLVLSASLLVPAASFANSGEHSDTCLLQGHRVTSVKPYETKRIEGPGHVAASKPAGAELYVRAEAGLTAEWLRLQLSREVADMHMKNCPLEDVTIRVDSAGPGFSVKLIARDPQHASEVLKQARVLFG
jgi:hypothetical protein